MFERFAILRISLHNVLEALNRRNLELCRCTGRENARVQAPDQIIAVVVLVNNLLSDDQWRPEFGLFGSEMHDGTDIGQAREIEARAALRRLPSCLHR